MSKPSYSKTPTVFQMEATECGAASLAMVLGYFGKHVPLEQMRIETGVSRDGCNMKNIMYAGRRFGLDVRGFRKSLEGLFDLPTPCIIHWNFNHFVVWEGRKGKYCYINDPAVGRRKLDVQDIDDSFTGVVLTFALTDDFQKSKRKDTPGSFVRERLKGQKGAILALILLGLFLLVPGIVVPIFSQMFIDDILLGGNYNWITALLAAMIGTALIKGYLVYYRSGLLGKLQNKLVLVSGHRFLSHMLRLPISFFDQRYAGDLSQRLDSNDKTIVFLTSDLAEAVLNCMVTPVYLVLLFFYSPLLTVIGVICVAVNLLIMHRAAKFLEDLSMKSQQDQSGLIGALFAGLSITGTLKASGTENEFVSRLQGHFARSIRVEQSMGMRQEILDSIQEVAQNILTVLTLLVGGVLVIRGDLTAGMLVAYTGLLEQFSEPVNSLAGFIQNIQTTKADMSRVNDILNYEQDEHYDQEAYADIKEQLIGNVEVKNLSFGYDIFKPPLIEDFSFELKSGRSIAFVGASGSGKSTVSKVCSGLYTPWDGELLFDGYPLRQVPPEVIAASLSTVSQNISLFSGSIRDNLTMWNRFVSNEDMVRAAKDACIHDFITSKPGAYDYQLAEGGSNLSGGQRQRIEIARALVSNPSILIMDEATSALDPVVEKEILDNIKRRGCTCIIVAHRLSAIRDCDEIIVLSHGKIVQRGTHDELARVPGHYQRLIQNI